MYIFKYFDVWSENMHNNGIFQNSKLNEDAFYSVNFIIMTEIFLRKWITFTTITILVWKKVKKVTFLHRRKTWNFIIIHNLYQLRSEK